MVSPTLFEAHRRVAAAGLARPSAAMPVQTRLTAHLSRAPATTRVLVGCTRRSKVHAAWRAGSSRGDLSGTAERRLSVVSL